MAWAKEEIWLETLKYKKTEDAVVKIPLRANKFMDYSRQKLLPAAISSSSLFTMALKWIPYAERLKAVISLSMT